MTSPGIPLNFYPRPPRGGRPHRRLPVWLVLCHFYPRPPRGGRRSENRRCKKCWRHFYPRPPRGGRHLLQVGDVLVLEFLSTPSARRATFLCKTNIAHFRNFYPRPPRGGRPASAAGAYRSSRDFYPRPPRGGRQINICNHRWLYEISIHALREEGDGPRGNV